MNYDEYTIFLSEVQSRGIQFDFENVRDRFGLIKHQLCPNCEYNIDIKEDEVCDDCKHLQFQPQKDRRKLVTSRLTQEQVEKNKEEIAARAKKAQNFVCPTCGREQPIATLQEFSRKDLTVHMCIDCLMNYLNARHMFIKETALAELVGFLKRKTFIFTEECPLDQCTPEKVQEIKKGMADKLAIAVHDWLSETFYGSFQKHNDNSQRMAKFKLEVSCLSPKDLVALQKIFCERDINNRGLLWDEYVMGEKNESCKGSCVSTASA